MDAFKDPKLVSRVRRIKTNLDIFQETPPLIHSNYYTEGEKTEYQTQLLTNITPVLTVINNYLYRVENNLDITPHIAICLAGSVKSIHDYLSDCIFISRSGSPSSQKLILEIMSASYEIRSFLRDPGNYTC